jgi:sugar/nucleoside kinase (ribokinase family)
VVTITRGIEGALVVFGGETTSVPAYRVERVVDTTGAGDLYAAGFLFGLTTGLSPQRCAALGALAASEVITHIGARNLVSMRSLAVEAGLLDGEG